ncbi:MAG: TerB family tellurite resistance protein [Bacteroidota bacterium]|nr:TerB family tellurite resistance protein [Bacteroidota bacterium]
MTTIIIVIIAALFIYALFSIVQKKPENPGTPPKKRGYGKWLGGGLGWAFGGPIGAILGFAMGSMFDGSSSATSAYRGTSRGDFAMSLLVLSAAVMKADKKIVRSELDYVRDFFSRQFGPDESSRMILILREVLQQDINIRDVSMQVGQFMDYPSRLQILHYLFGIAVADGQCSQEEADVIGQISGYMGVNPADFSSIRAMFVKNVSWAYDVLEITPSATNDEVKKAYREMAKKHHPDMVAHLGEDVRKAATEKFQQINEAYEQIKKERGIN